MGEGVVDPDGQQRLELGGPGLQFHVPIGVVFRVPTDALMGAVEQVWSVEDHRWPPVGERDASLGFGHHGSQSDLIELEVLDHRHDVEELHVLGMEIEPESREQRFLGVDSAPFLVATLDHRGAQPRPLEVGSQTQTVVSSTDDHRVVHPRSHPRPPFRSRRPLGAESPPIVLKPTDAD